MVKPNKASKAITLTGMMAFLKLKISATKQKTPKPTIAINVFILN